MVDWLHMRGPLVAALALGLLGVAGSALAQPAAPAPHPSPVPDLATCADHYQAKRYRPARDCFAALVAKGDRTPALRFALGYCHYQLGEHRAAERRFQEASALDPADGDFRFMRALALVRLKREADAIRELRKAVALGLRSEDPVEARRLLGLLERLRKARPRRGWLVRVGARVGYDSRPRLEGAAAVAGSSDGESDAGSAVVTLQAGLGYRLLHGRWGSTTADYGFQQRLVLSDVLTQGSGRAGRFATRPPELSLQVHRLRLELRAAGARVSGGLRVAGEVELAGLRSFAPLVAGLPVEGELRLHWHPLTQTQLSLGGAWQQALDPGVAYLGGGGLWTGIAQSLRWKVLSAQLGYTFASWWLGTAEQPVADCPAAEACALVVPYTHLAHRLLLSLAVRARPWLVLAAEAGLGHRRYRPAARYRTVGGQEKSLTRVDLTPQAGATIRFRLVRGLWLDLAYRYQRNQSTVNEAAVGVEEGYERHVAELGLTYARW